MQKKKGYTPILKFLSKYSSHRLMGHQIIGHTS